MDAIAYHILNKAAGGGVRAREANARCTRLAAGKIIDVNSAFV